MMLLIYTSIFHPMYYCIQMARRVFVYYIYVDLRQFLNPHQAMPCTLSAMSWLCYIPPLLCLLSLSSLVSRCLLFISSKCLQISALNSSLGSGSSSSPNSRLVTLFTITVQFLFMSSLSLTVSPIGVAETIQKLMWAWVQVLWYAVENSSCWLCWFSIVASSWSKKLEILHVRMLIPQFQQNY